MTKDNFGPYSTAAAPALLRAIRKFLFTDLAMMEMKVATKLRHPAVEPLSDHLLEKFGEVVRADGVKKYVGWITRQVMESQGYRIEQQNCLVRTGDLFSRGTRYCKNTQRDGELELSPRGRRAS